MSERPVRNVKDSRIALVVLLGGAVAIAFAPIFVRLSETGPVATAFWRVALAVPALALWRAAERRNEAPAPASRRDRVLLAIAGLCFAGDLAVWHWSIKLTSVANATLLANFAPLIVTPGAYLLFRERFHPCFLLGLAFSLVGAALLMGQSLTLSADHIVGDALGLVSATFYAGYMLAVTGARSRLSSASIMLWSGVVTSLVLAPMAWFSGDILFPATAAGWATLVGLALFSHAAGQGMIAYAFAHLPASFASVALLLQPAVAALLAWLLFGENLGPLQALGAAVIVAGIVIARRASGR